MFLLHREYKMQHMYINVLYVSLRNSNVCEQGLATSVFTICRYFNIKVYCPRSNMILNHFALFLMFSISYVHHVFANRCCLNCARICTCNKENDGWTAKCSSLNLTSFPVFQTGVVWIDLSHNNLTFFPEKKTFPNSLRYLDLSWNPLRYIPRGAFQNMQHLDSLILTYYRNVFIILSLHTEMDENRCTNGIIRVANYSELYHVCASVFIHFCMQRQNNENIPYNLITNKKYIC